MIHDILKTTQGLGIALVAAQRAGVDVSLIDSSQASLDKGMKFAGTIIQLQHVGFGFFC